MSNFKHNVWSELRHLGSHLRERELVLRAAGGEELRDLGPAIDEVVAMTGFRAFVGAHELEFQGYDTCGKVLRSVLPVQLGQPSPTELEGWRLVVNKKVQHNPMVRLMHVLKDAAGPIYLEAVWHGLVGGMGKRPYLEMLDNSDGSLDDEPDDLAEMYMPASSSVTLPDVLPSTPSDEEKDEVAADQPEEARSPPENATPAVQQEAAQPADMNGDQFRLMQAIVFAEALYHPCLAKLRELKEECCPWLQPTPGQLRGLENTRLRRSRKEQYNVINEFLQSDRIVDGADLIVPAAPPVDDTPLAEPDFEIPFEVDQYTWPFIRQLGARALRMCPPMLQQLTPTLTILDVKGRLSAVPGLPDCRTEFIFLEHRLDASYSCQRVFELLKESLSSREPLLHVGVVGGESAHTDFFVLLRLGNTRKVSLAVFEVDGIAPVGIWRPNCSQLAVSLRQGAILESIETYTKAVTTCYSEFALVEDECEWTFEHLQALLGSLNDGQLQALHENAKLAATRTGLQNALIKCFGTLMKLRGKKTDVAELLTANRPVAEWTHFHNLEEFQCTRLDEVTGDDVHISLRDYVR